MTKRVDIKTGFMCNNNCLFCVQGDKKKHGNRDKKDIFRDMEEGKKNGCNGVVLTGGEVSIRNDFFELISYAKKLDFELIQVQSNGRRFYYEKFVNDAVKAGMNEFSPAVHGHTPELHDYLTQTKGAFNQVCQAIKNVKKHGIHIISNTVVVKPNYRYLPEIANLLVSLKVDQFQFAFVHAVGSAGKNFDQMVPRVSLASPYIKKGLQVGIDNNIKVMAEAMPFCTMEGYEKYVSELYIPDTEIRSLDSYVPDFEKSRKNHGKVKFPQCKECAYDLICEGPWRSYPDNLGNDEFRPVLNADLSSLMSFFETNFYNTLYGNILDIGCGIFTKFEIYKEICSKSKITKIHCFDPNSTLKEISKKIFAEVKDQFIFEVNTLKDIELKENHYDNIVFRYVFNHLNLHEQSASFKKIFKSIKPGGKLYFLSEICDKERNLTTSNSYDKIKEKIEIYKDFFSSEEYARFRKETLKYYFPSTEENKYCNYKELVTLITRAGFTVIHKLEGVAYGEKTLQVIAIKPN